MKGRRDIYEGKEFNSSEDLKIFLNTYFIEH